MVRFSKLWPFLSDILKCKCTPGTEKNCDLFFWPPSNRHFEGGYTKLSATDSTNWESAQGLLLLSWHHSFLKKNRKFFLNLIKQRLTYFCSKFFFFPQTFVQREHAKQHIRFCNSFVSRNTSAILHWVLLGSTLSQQTKYLKIVVLALMLLSSHA